MKKSRYTDEQIAYALKQAGLGTPVAEVCREMGISDATFYNWRTKFGGLSPSEVRHMKQLECAALKLSRSVYGYQSVARDSSALVMRIREITQTRVHYGYRRVNVMLRRESWRDNHKRVYRLYREQGLS